MNTSKGTANRVMPDVLYRTYNAMRWGQSVEDIRTMLLNTGLSEYEAWLTYKGAELIINNPQ
jgi:hypothetical protein